MRCYMRVTSLALTRFILPVMLVATSVVNDMMSTFSTARELRRRAS